MRFSRSTWRLSGLLFVSVLIFGGIWWARQEQRAALTRQLVRLLAQYRGATLPTDETPFSMREQQVLLERGASANGLLDGESLLWWMSGTGSVPEVKLLVRYGADVNWRGRDGTSPLLRLAQTYGTAEAMKLLLDKGADVNAIDKHGRSALHGALFRGSYWYDGPPDEEVVRLLLDRGTDPNLVDDQGYAPINLVAKLMAYRPLETTDVDRLFRLLLDHGADASHRSSEGRTALEHIQLYLPAKSRQVDPPVARAVEMLKKSG